MIHYKHFIDTDFYHVIKMSSTLQQKINELERRLKLENKSRDHDQAKNMVTGKDFTFSRPPKPETVHQSPARRPRPGRAFAL